MKIFELLQVSIDFSTIFLNNFASFGRGPRPPPTPTTNVYFQNFLNFRENFDKIVKLFKKSQNFL